VLIDQIKNPDGSVNKNTILKAAKYFGELLENGAKKDLELRGKSLELANRENSSLQHYYEGFRVQLNCLLKYLEVIIERHRSKVFQHLTEKNSRDLSDKAKDRYIDGNDEYLSLFEAYIAVKEVHDNYASVVEAFRSRGFQLRNITELRINAIHDDVL